MQTDLRGRDFIGDMDFSKEEIETVLDVAFKLKRDRALGIPHPLLRDRTLAMLFFFTSTRTRSSFEAGMAQLGGHAAFVDSTTTQISHGDTAKEIGEIFGRYYDGIAIRQCDWSVGNGYINGVADASRVPVLNMRCDVYHPFQILADLMTIIEKVGDPRQDYQRELGLCQQLSEAHLRAAKPDLADDALRHERRLTHPPEYKLMPDIVQQAKDNAALRRQLRDAGRFRRSASRTPTSSTPRAGARVAHDVQRRGERPHWPPVHGLDRGRAAHGLAKPNAIYMHCLAGGPQYRGYGRRDRGRSLSSMTKPKTGFTPRRP